MMLIGLPSTLPPKSSTAICAAVTEPWPVGVDAGPFMSVRTPILTTSSEIWARAACDDKTAAANAPSTDIFLAEIKTVLPLSFGTLAVLLDRELELGRQDVLAIILRSASTELTGSGREADLAGGRRVVAGKFRRALLQPLLTDKADQCLNRWPEIAALPHQQIKILPQQRDEIEARRFRRGAGRDAAIRLAAADGNGEIGTRETRRIEPPQILGSGAGARQQHVVQHPRTSAGLPDGHLRAGDKDIGQAEQMFRIARSNQKALLTPREGDQHRIMQARHRAHR